MGVGFFGQGSDCRDCGGTGERTFANLDEKTQKYLTERKKVIDNLKIT
jgi:hypothetical protein